MGYLITYSLIKKLKLPFKWYWIALGLFAAILPDFGIIYQLFSGRLHEVHRYYITNLPLAYLTVFVLVVIVNCFLKKKWLKYANFIVFASIFVHLIIDTTFYGIRWLWPFYPKLIAIYNIDGTGGIRVLNYYQHWLWYLEITLWIAVPVFIVYTFLKERPDNKSRE